MKPSTLISRMRLQAGTLCRWCWFYLVLGFGISELFLFSRRNPFCLVDVGFWKCKSPIYGNVASRTAISDMVVRGAPAIAIAAALALAVEVENLKPASSGTGQEAVAFLKERLDYLVSRFIAPSQFLVYFCAM